MKNRRWWILGIAAVIAAGLWFWRYTTMNAWYDSFSNVTDVLYQTGEIVAFGENMTSDKNTLDGYAIRVDGMKIMETDEFMELYGVEKGAFASLPERMALVSITLFNEDSDEDVLLTEFVLHGTDNYVGMLWGLIGKVNPELQGYYAVRLAHGQEYELVLPYLIFRDYFGSDTWQHMDEYDWKLRITCWPEEIDIAVTPHA